MRMPQGFQWGGARCGLKNRRNDVGLLVSSVPARAAGVFTTNNVRAACVDYTRASIADGILRAIVVNSGNANCCTGLQGERDTESMAHIAAGKLEIDPSEVAVASTGVIGQLLDMAKVEIGVSVASMELGSDPVPFMDAILTTDLVEKWAYTDDTGVLLEKGARVEGGHDGKASIYGVAKGSGMIAPNMATMLGFLATDWDVSDIDLQGALKAAADVSFNCMTVDGDTSTNDMLLILANGESGVKPTADEFQRALERVCVSLAKQIARDGEGATKLVEVRVRGTEDPKKVARTIAESPLVKTAMFGCDPNWGRIMMAAGRSGVAFDPKDARLRIVVGDEEFLLFEGGGPAAFDAKRVSTALKSDHVVIDLSLEGDAVGLAEQATVYTCDFGYGYVRINAEYHT
jgi:glutamate N-acetyltransferase / amino-acid N-acetyltransferase